MATITAIIKNHSDINGKDNNDVKEDNNVINKDNDDKINRQFEAKNLKITL